MGCANSTANSTRVAVKVGQKGKLKKPQAIGHNHSDATSKPDWLKDRPHIQVIHFNDVYNIEEKATSQKNDSSLGEETTDPTVIVAGASRFVSAFDQRESQQKLVLFSGDLFSPSHLSTILKGEQMLEVFNRLNVQVSCLGNHDLDFGVDKMRDLTSRTAPCKWLLSNLYVEGKPIGDIDTFLVKEVPLAGQSNQKASSIKVGFFGLAGPDWLGQMCPIVTEKLDYIDYVEKGREMVKFLKSQMDCKLVIALTHMRLPDDKVLASSVPEIDFILGGHDHAYITEVDPETGVFVIKSGTDFEEFNEFDVVFDASEADFAQVKQGDSELVKHLYSPAKQMLIRVEKVQITNAIERDAGIEAHISANTSELNKRMDEVCGYIDVDMEGRFEHLRYEETNCANFVSDLIRTEFDQSDLAILNCGTLRSNAIIPKGDITLRMVQDLLPMPDKIVLLRVSGAIVLQLLENSVSQWPALDGRFACLSGLKYSFDPDYPSGDRVHSVTRIDGSEFDLSEEAQYTLAVKYFIALGKDGYTAFNDPSVEWLSDYDSAMGIQDIIVQAFERTGPNYAIQDKREETRQQRMTLLQASDSDRSEKGFVKLRPQLDGRLKREAKPKTMVSLE